MAEDQNCLKVKKLLFSFIILVNLISFANSQEIKLTKLVDLDNPWGSTFINDHEILITEKFGKIKLINLKNLQISLIEHNINYLVDGQGGLLDILFNDDYVFVSYSENRGSGETSTSVTKGKFDRKKIDFKNIFRAEPPIKSGYHFGPAGKLFEITTSGKFNNSTYTISAIVDLPILPKPEEKKSSKKKSTKKKKKSKYVQELMEPRIINITY